MLPPVFYSVGTDTSDLKTGSPDITIAGGVATLDVAQTNDIGVGDVIDFADPSSPVYIWDVVSPTQFRVQNADGSAATDVPGPSVGVATIERAFNSIAQAETDSSDGSHLGTPDLVAAGRSLTWVVYNDSPFIVTGTTTISGYNTDAGHFITIIVARASQTASGVSQRHAGIAGTGALMDGSSVEHFGLSILDDFTRVDGLELARFFDPLVNGSAAIRVAAANVLLENLLVYDFLSPMPFDHGIKTPPAGPSSFTIRNSVIYDGDNDGIYIGAAGDVVTVDNCTFYDVDNGIRNDGTVTITNTISTANSVSFLNTNVMTGSNNMSNDATAPGPASITGIAATDQFVDISPGTENLHLRPGSDAIDAGIDLSVRFGDDIDGDARPQGAAWEMGADESFFSGATTYYRSIGTAADLVGAGETITVTAGSATVTKTGGLGWLAENRGRGDVLIVNGADQYMILRVVSDDVLTLASLATTSYTGGTYTIARQFTTLFAWESCIDGQGGSPPPAAPCFYFPAPTSSLPADDRREIGIAYKESAFTSAGGVPIVLFQSSTTDQSHDITLTADGVNRHFGIRRGSREQRRSGHAGGDRIGRSPHPATSSSPSSGSRSPAETGWTGFEVSAVISLAKPGDPAVQPHPRHRLWGRHAAPGRRSDRRRLQQHHLRREQGDRD